LKSEARVGYEISIFFISLLSFLYTNSEYVTQYPTQLHRSKENS
jgi:hypothetical protein